MPAAILWWLSSSDSVGGTDRTPVFAEHADRRRDQADQHLIALARVAELLDGVGPGAARAGEAHRVVVHAPVAGIAFIPERIAGALLLRVLGAMHRDVAVAVDRRTKRHVRVGVVER